MKKIYAMWKKFEDERMEETESDALNTFVFFMCEWKALV